MSDEAASHNAGRSVSSVGTLDASSTHASMLAKFEALREEGLTETESAILAVIERLVLSTGQDTIPQSSPDNPVARSPDTSTSLASQLASTSQVPDTSGGSFLVTHVSDAVRAAADEIDELCANSLDDAELFLTTMWEILLCVVRIVPYNHPGQDRIVSVLETLRLRAKTTVHLWGKERRLWRDFPLLSPCIREAWSDPMEDAGKNTVTTDEASDWVNLNAFVGRITSKGLVDCSIYAVIEIPKALEKEIPPSGLAREYKLRTASNWILISGVKLFKDAFKGDTLDEVELRATAPGPLYVETGGRPGLCMDRWRFWLRRFRELVSDDVDDRVGHEATQAAHRMEEIMKEDGRAEVRRLGTTGEDDQAN
ncbi:hypothetical protein CDV31_013609 [Fusarium ambrosium]|uniref:Uncharacterized protein n=1 Tax=Fusarium ambrosium TaxID=131363 RepID=A0A428T265_9HYPO|nr:hypothetical protein CDV31_013609 [Fusarium ambrosium]